MKAPLFWTHNQKSLWPGLLSPLSLIYGALTRSRATKPPSYKSTLPVICIGNLTMGGAGKTPTALSLAQTLIEQGKKPIFLSRGYGGTQEGPVMVAEHKACEVGDEPLLLKQIAPVCISRDRQSGAKLCEQQGCDIIIMDDGFQNPHLHKDVSLLVVDGGFGHGNEKIFPAGPLRESLESGLKRADALVLIGEDKTHCLEQIKATAPNLPLLKAEITAHSDTDIKSNRLVAFAGIARPEKFFETVKSLGGDMAKTLSFPDHHRFSDQDIIQLEDTARQFDAQLITTEKDRVRLPEKIRANVAVVKIALAWKRPDVLKAVLSSILS